MSECVRVHATAAFLIIADSCFFSSIHSRPGSDAPNKLLSDLIPRMQAILDLLTLPQVASLLRLHPNCLGLSSFVCPAEWNSWWNWAGADDVDPQQRTERLPDPWLSLLWFYEACRPGVRSSGSCSYMQNIPGEISKVIKGFSEVSLPRDAGRSFPIFTDGPTYLLSSRSPTTLDSPQGMSPKKAHEVGRMTAFLQELLASNTFLRNTSHVVDIGAGQVRH